jgi:NADH-quinone oxidoreductase subunit J
MTIQILVFLILAAIAIGTAVGMLVSRNAIYAVLFLVSNFITVAVLYLLLGAPFISLAQVTVYAGAIMVLFLFVIMLLGGEKLPVAAGWGKQRWAIIGVAVVVLVEAGLLLVLKGDMSLMLVESAMDAGPASIGMTLFTKYALPFELTSVILLSALVGAIVLTKQDKP